jgi:L-threonate 2-dehydrogenase
MDGRGTEEKLVGIVGLGIMGGAISANLVQRGWSVIGYDIDETRRHEATGAGVTVVDDVAQVAARSPIIMTSLPAPEAARTVAQTIALEASPRTVLELSTFALDDKLGFKSILDAGNHVALDCPLSGTGAQAKCETWSFTPAVIPRQSSDASLSLRTSPSRASTSVHTATAAE